MKLTSRITGALAVVGLAVGLLTVAAPAEATTPRTTVKVASFNVDSAWRQMVDPSIPHWESRVQGIARIINTAKPDVIGIQEAPDINVAGHVYHQADDIRRMTSYAMYQAPDAATKIDPILYRAGLFTLVGSGYKVFENKPYPVYGRAMTWVKLRSKATGQTFLVANTHFQVGADQQAVRDREGVLLAAELKRVAGGVPVFVTGDFNSSASKTAPQTKNLAAIGVTDTYAMTASRTHGDLKSYNGYRWPVAGSSRIDQVYAGAPAAKDLKVSHWENWTAYGNQAIGGRPPSDHDMLITTSSFK